MALLDIFRGNAAHKEEVHPKKVGPTDEVMLIFEIMQAPTLEAREKICREHNLSKPETARLLGKASALRRGERANYDFNKREQTALSNQIKQQDLDPSLRHSSGK